MAKKAKQKDLGYFLKREYDVTLKKRGEHLILFMPELCLLAEDKDLAEAYKKLEDAKVKYFQKIIDYNLQDTFSDISKEKRDTRHKKLSSYNLSSFMIKFIIIIFIGFISVQVVSNKVMNKIRTENIFDATKRAVGTISVKIAAMPDEKKEELKLKLRDVIHNIKPFTDEFKVLLEDNPKNISKKAQLTTKGNRKEDADNPNK